MPPDERNAKQLQREETQAAILAAAARVFAEAGFGGARTEAIAAAAGVNKALIHYYFKSKERLYRAVFEERFRGFHEGAYALLTAPGAARATLLRYVEFHFDRMSRERHYASLQQQFMMKSGKALEPLIRQYAMPHTLALRQLLERGIKEGEFRECDVRHTAISLVSLITHYFSIAPKLASMIPFDPYAKPELERRRGQVLDFVRYGLFRDPEAALS